MKLLGDYFAELAEETSYDKLPKEAVDHAKLILLDYLGSLIGAKDFESSKIAIELAEEFGGEETATIVGSSKKVSPMNAVFANAIQGYSFDFIDDHNESKAHPSAATLPVALNLCEAKKASGRELIEAIAVGNETVSRLGAAYVGKMADQGFHPTAVLATFGATMVAVKCKGLSHEQALHAQGLAGGCMAGGLYAWNAGDNYAKRLNAGHPARNGILAAKLAEKDFKGPLDVYESEGGALNAFSYHREYDMNEATKGIGQEWSFATSSIKPYPCCRYGGPHIDACTKIVREHNPDLNEIKRILVRTQSAQIALLIEPKKVKYNPQCTVDGQFSMPFQAAVAMVKGQATVDEFTEECIQDPMVQKLMPLVEAEVDPVFEARYPDQYSSSVTVEMNDGTTFLEVTDNPLGDWRNPVTYEFVESKFRNLAGKSMFDEVRVQKVIDFINCLEEKEDVSELMELINHAI